MLTKTVSKGEEKEDNYCVPSGLELKSFSDGRSNCETVYNEIYESTTLFTDLYFPCTIDSVS